jgi:hypothetical protein
MGLGHLRDGYDHLPTTDHRYAKCLAYVSSELEMGNSGPTPFTRYDPGRPITMVVEEVSSLLIRHPAVSLCIYCFHLSERFSWLMLAV